MFGSFDGAPAAAPVSSLPLWEVNDGAVVTMGGVTGKESQEHWDIDGNFGDFDSF